MEKARHEKEKTEKECDLVKRKAKDLKTLLTPGMEMTDEKLQHLVSEIKDYRKKMEKAEVQMKSSSLSFMTAHLATMKVLGVAREVKYGERFSRKGPRDVRCMFCTMLFDSHKMRKRDILSYHWKVFEITVFLIFVQKCNCKCICMCKYIWIFYI